MIELTLDNFDEEVRSGGLVLVDWWGETCENCLAIMPDVVELSEKYGDKVKFTKFNTSQKGVKRFCIKERVLGLPVISLYSGDEKIDELAKDDCNKENIEAMIKKHI